jgi:hypothetical protein
MLSVPVYKCSTGMDYKIRLPQGTGYKRGYKDRIKLVSQKSRLLQDKRRIISADIG